MSSSTWCGERETVMSKIQKILAADPNHNFKGRLAPPNMERITSQWSTWYQCWWSFFYAKHLSTFFLTNIMNHAEWSLTMVGLYKMLKFFVFFRSKKHDLDKKTEQKWSCNYICLWIHSITIKFLSSLGWGGTRTGAPTRVSGGCGTHSSRNTSCSWHCRSNHSDWSKIKQIDINTHSLALHSIGCFLQL